MVNPDFNPLSSNFGVTFLICSHGASSSSCGGAVHFKALAAEPKQKREVLLEELSRLISSLHSAAYCLCNGEELLDVMSGEYTGGGG